MRTIRPGCFVPQVHHLAMILLIRHRSTSTDMRQGAARSSVVLYTGAPEFRSSMAITWFGDYCSAEIWSLSRDSSESWRVRLLIDAEAGLTSFGTGYDGETYVAIGNTVFRIDPD